MTMEVAETVEERTEVARDLKLAAQQALGVENERREWEITDASPRRKLYVLYNTITGARIEVPKFIFDVAVNRMIPGTNKFAFTAFKDKAPPEQKGTVLCFLHPDSPEREVLREIGVYTECDNAALRNGHAKRVHAQNRHRSEWAAYQEHVAEQETKQWREQSRIQTEATLRLASAAEANAPKPANPLEAMTNAQLREMADERGVDVRQATNKAQLIAALEVSDG